MTKYSEMNPTQKRIYNACHNGWFMGGHYRALFDDHQRDFYADSAAILAHEIEPWYAKHEQHHVNAPILVKCVQAL